MADSDDTLRPGQHALVTGAGSGIGRAIALALGGEGLAVTLVGRSAEKLADTARQLGQDSQVIAADITTEAGRAAVAQAADPELHVLVHSAAVYARTSFAEISPSAWRELEAINLHAPILLTSVCLSALRNARGQVVFINSTAIQQAAPGLGAYAASKHALKAAADSLRHEVNPDGIRVLSLFPGRTDTPMQRAILAREQRTARPGALLQAGDVARMTIAALKLPASAEVTDIVMRPMRPL